MSRSKDIAVFILGILKIFEMIFLWNSWSFDSEINLNVFYSIRAAAYNWPFERSLDFDPNFLQAKCENKNIWGLVEKIQFCVIEGV